MRVIAFDIGDKYTGYAISDKLGTVASQSGVFLCEPDLLLSEIKKIITETDADAIVVGVPYSLKGEKTPQTEKVLNLIKELKNELNIPVYEIDERLTTVEAEKVMRQFKKKNKIALNEIAAKLILATFLERLKGSKDVF